MRHEFKFALELRARKYTVVMKDGRVITVTATNREDALLLAQSEAGGGVARKIIKHRI